MQETTTPQNIKGEPCYLKRLPPELRNTICEEHFSYPAVGEIELATRPPFSKALLLSCRYVYGEAVSVYRAAYCKYCEETEFYIHKPHDYLVDGATEEINPDNLGHVRKLIVCTPRPGRRFEYDDGIWKHTIRQDTPRLSSLRSDEYAAVLERIGARACRHVGFFACWDIFAMCRILQSMNRVQQSTTRAATREGGLTWTSLTGILTLAIRAH